MILLAIALSIHMQVAVKPCPVGEAWTQGGCVVPPASPTDGTEPTYTTEPVTQKIPHCYAGQKLMMLEEAVSAPRIMGGEEPYGGLFVPREHPARWVDAGEYKPEVHYPSETFRCFKDESWTGPTTASVSSMCIDETCLEADPLAVRVGKRWSAFLPKGDPKPNQQIVCDVMTPNTTLYSCHWK